MWAHQPEALNRTGRRLGTAHGAHSVPRAEWLSFLHPPLAAAASRAFACWLARAPTEDFFHSLMASTIHNTYPAVRTLQRYAMMPLATMGR